MREIKFKGKRLDNGEWVYGCLIIDEVSGKYYIPLTVDESDKVGQEGCLYVVSCEVDPSTVGEFTGLHDKNGKEIYEGDIISLVISSGEKTTVICKFGNVIRQIFENTVEITGFYFERDIDGKKTFPIVHNYAGKHDLELFEVIGNIHDNPELLEEKV